MHVFIISFSKMNDNTFEGYYVDFKRTMTARGVDGRVRVIFSIFVKGLSVMR